MCICSKDPQVYNVYLLQGSPGIQYVSAPRIPRYTMCVFSKDPQVYNVCLLPGSPGIQCVSAPRIPRYTICVCSKDPQVYNVCLFVCQGHTHTQTHTHTHRERERERERERGDERRGGKLITIRKDVKKRSGSRYLTCWDKPRQTRNKIQLILGVLISLINLVSGSDGSPLASTPPPSNFLNLPTFKYANFQPKLKRPIFLIFLIFFAIFDILDILDILNNFFLEPLSYWNLIVFMQLYNISPHSDKV